MPGRTFLNLSKLFTFAAAPLVLTPFVRNQVAPLATARARACASFESTLSCLVVFVPPGEGGGGGGGGGSRGEGAGRAGAWREEQQEGVGVSSQVLYSLVF